MPEHTIAAGGDISSLLEIAFALNFGYALIRALADFELRSRTRMATELLAIAKMKFNKNRARYDECESENRYFQLELSSRTPRIRKLSNIVFTYCFALGIASVFFLLALEFKWFTLSDNQKIVVVLFLILTPILSALVLWAACKYLMKGADKHLHEMRAIVTSP